ncbi:MarR family winged helix-turn-helix transcriptional regulator [Kibdelosporangium phytohabitans]|uniref:MarR family transcriptional regulator n=1 Tax=Kibdelosporangium phytohabitans TaxID=860235 RepID=A0A0N9HSF8_9PSEU|nr:MarR family transcriptional regulator [Kibdelosporangium phytohabitans]ALG05702.1 MarR family transcriptional regulator [Kibdelosporangium phytohabitans]MBE1466311.1 DNA-binding MarR family transcriptional regulator [Kibdelosporangium phytohabitans]
MTAEPRWLTAAELRAWRAYVIGSERLRQRLNTELQEGHDLPLADYEVLVRLSEQDKGQMRMTQLADEVAQSKSRLSHQISRLEAAGLVRRTHCPNDARGVLAEITETGMDQLRTAAPTHVDGVREHLVDLITPAEREVLADVFERVLTHLDKS